MEGMESSENYRNYMEIMCLIELMYRRVSVIDLKFRMKMCVFNQNTK